MTELGKKEKTETDKLLPEDVCLSCEKKNSIEVAEV